jgi:hypothetical protein
MRHRCLRIRCGFSDESDTDRDSYSNADANSDSDTDSYANRKSDTHAGATDIDTSATDTYASAADTHAGFVDPYAGFHTDSRDGDHHQSRLGRYGLRSGDVHLQQSGRQRQSVHR